MVLVRNGLIKNVVLNVRWHMPKKWAHAYIYYRTHGKTINYHAPKTYDEKIHWCSVNIYNEDYARYADKWEVRTYVKECGLERLLIPCIAGPYDDVNELDFSTLPNEFIIKATHGSGDMYYYICHDKKNEDLQSVSNKFAVALKSNLAKLACEYQYASIKPRVMCETLLKSEGHERIDDYKLVCSRGKVIAILVCSDRDEGRDYFTNNWEYLDYTKEEYRSHHTIKKPDNLSEMINAASKLSMPFPLARIDFYDVNGRLYFGEITLTPSAGNHIYLNEKAQIEIGEAIELL